MKGQCDGGSERGSKRGRDAKKKNGVWEAGKDEEKDGREKERREGERER